MSVAQLWEGEIVGDYWPVVPNGKYSARLVHFETAIVFSPKVFLHFEILTPGPHQGVRLFRAYRVHQLRGRPRRRGQFKLRAGSDLYRTICRLTPAKKRPDRIALTPLMRLVLQISTRTVTTDSKQRPLPDSCRYSVVDDILKVEAGNNDTL